jgi:tetratricopeptide (TPR) repeat protein
VLAFAEARTVSFGGNVDTALSTARQEAQATRAMDDDDPWSYFSSGYVECFLSKYDDAIAWYRRAIKLNENFALAHGNMAAALAFGGQPDAAIEAVERSIRMSPRDPFNFSYLHFAGIAYFAAERYAEGVAYEEQALRERQMFLRHFLVSPPVMSVSDRSTKHGAPSQRCCGWFRKVRSRETPMARLPTLARVIGSDSRRPCARPDCRKNSTHAP